MSNLSPSNKALREYDTQTQLNILADRTEQLLLAIQTIQEGIDEAIIALRNENNEPS